MKRETSITIPANLTGVDDMTDLLPSTAPSTTPSATDSPYFAAIDLGSNSFHMLIVKYNDGALEVVDRVKDMVQIARGLKRDNRLSPAAQGRALHCLSCFQERIREIPPRQIRAVGTKALRSAENSHEFIHKAEAALGHPIDIISGYEEARLVYLGVSHDISRDKGRPLIMDIGGGSTEFIIGDGIQPVLMESLSIGCVVYSDNHFTDSDGNPVAAITEQMIREAYYATCLELELISRRYRRHGWDIAVGSSGTMRAVAELMPTDTLAGVITREGLNQLVDTIKINGSLPKADNVSSERHSVLPAGIIILTAIFDQLHLDEIHVVNATLKEGLIYDTLGRFTAKDMRDQTVDKLIEQYQIDREQADRVATTLRSFVNSLEIPDIDGVNVRQILHWAALLHEIGLSISHSGYHKHGAYLIRHSDLAGFTRFEQELLALFVDNHRRKIRTEGLQIVDTDTMHSVAVLIACLRLAVLLHHRRDDDFELPRLQPRNETITLQFSPGWLDDHPLTQRNLVKEQRYLKRLNLQLVFH